MFKGLKKAVKSGISAVAEQAEQLNLGNVNPDASLSTNEGNGSSENRVEGVKQQLDKGKEVVHKVKHYGALGEEYLGFSDPTKELRKAVKQKEKAAKKARKQKKKLKEDDDLFSPANLAKYKQELELKRSKEANKEANKDFNEASNKQSPEEPQRSDSKKVDKGDDDDDFDFHLDDKSAGPNQDYNSKNRDTSDDNEDHERSDNETKDDWKLFKNLTSGVDDVVERTRSGLDQLKQESYFQQKKVEESEEKKPKKKKKKKWVDLDHEGFDDYDGQVEHDLTDDEDDQQHVEHDQHPVEETRRESLPAEKKEFVAETEKGVEAFSVPEEGVRNDSEDEELFHTEFVDAVTSGQLKLVHVDKEDDKEEEEDNKDHDDPFDTTHLDQIVKEEKESRRRESNRLKFVGLSDVAEVLSGQKSELEGLHIEHSVRSKRRRANRINLIGDNLTKKDELHEHVVSRKREDDKDKDKGDKEHILDDRPEDQDTQLLESLVVVSPVEKKVGESKGVSRDNNKENNDWAEFDENAAANLHSRNKELTSNVAILSGELAAARTEVEDEFDDAFDALVQERVTETKLDELATSIVECDDLFDTSAADNVLNLASLLDKVDEKSKEKEFDETNFDDPFDTTHVEDIADNIETELAFQSLANRVDDGDKENEDNNEHNEGNERKRTKLEEIDVFGNKSSSESSNNDNWATFKSPKPPPRPSRPPTSTPARPSAPPAQQLNTKVSVVIKAPSSESIESWSNTTAEKLIRNGEHNETFDVANEQRLDEQDEEEEDPFDVSHVDIGDHREDEHNKQVEENKEITDNRDKEKEDDDDADPFDTNYACEHLVEKDDPFDTTHITRGEPQSASDHQVAEVSVDEEEKDVFDTSAVSSLLPFKKASSSQVVEDEDFDPHLTFQKSRKLDEADPFDTSAANNALGNDNDNDNDNNNNNNNNNSLVKRQESSDSSDFDPRA